MNKFSNILKFPPFSNQSLELLRGICDRLKLIEPVRNIITSYNDYKKDMKLILENVSIEDYPEKTISQITKNDDMVLMTLNVVDYRPSELDQISKLYCPETHER